MSINKLDIFSNKSTLSSAPEDKIKTDSENPVMNRIIAAAISGIFVKTSDIETFNETSVKINVPNFGLSELFDGYTLKLIFLDNIQFATDKNQFYLKIGNLEDKKILVSRESNLSDLTVCKMVKSRMDGRAGFDETKPYRFCDKGIKLELIYSKENNCFIVDPNTVVMNYSDNGRTSSIPGTNALHYRITADGMIEQWGHDPSYGWRAFSVEYRYQPVGTCSCETTGYVEDSVSTFTANTTSFYMLYWGSRSYTMNWRTIGR